MTRYLYADNLYETVADVEKAVTAFKVRLDNNPTDWCAVKPLIETRKIVIHSPSPEAPLDPDGSDEPKLVKSSSNNPVPVYTHIYGDPFSDEEINNLIGSNQNMYNVFAVHDGDNHTYVSEPEAMSLVSQMRTSYANWKNADKYFDTQVDEGQDSIEINVSNEDMTQYVS